MKNYIVRAVINGHETVPFHTVEWQEAEDRFRELSKLEGVTEIRIGIVDGADRKRLQQELDT